MISDTGVYVLNGVTETGHSVFYNLTETGQFSVFGESYSAIVGLVIGGTGVSAQMLCSLLPVVLPEFTLTNASTNFKLEQQP